MSNRRKLGPNDDPNRPRLKKAPGAGTEPVDKDGKKTEDPDERPTLKRRN